MKDVHRYILQRHPQTTFGICSNNINHLVISLSKWLFPFSLYRIHPAVSSLFEYNHSR